MDFSKILQIHQLPLDIFVGTVMEAGQTSKTDVSSTGAGSTLTIQSNTINQLRFFLMDKQGNEKAIDLENWDIPLRQGHTIHVVYIKEYVVAVFNENLNLFSLSESAVKSIAKLVYYRYFLASILTMVVLPFLTNALIPSYSTVSITFFIGVGIWLLYQFKWRKTASITKQQIKKLQF